MNYTQRLIQREAELGRPIRVGVVGAGQMGSGLIAQIERAKGMEVAVASGGGAAKTPDEIIAKHCNACHGTGLLGAPKIGDTAAWKERADHQGGLDGILAKAITGINAMPPKGTCADCSDDDLKGAIKKMSGL